MTNEPEPRSIGERNHSSSSVEAHLNTFKARLDREKTGVTTIIPGFLFRNGRERRVALIRQYPFSARLLYVDDLTIGLVPYGPAPEIDDVLLRQHTETYRRGLEARDQLLDRINAIEIIEMVRDVWGRGEIDQKAGEVILRCNYAFAKEEIKGSYVPGYINEGTPVSGSSFVASHTMYRYTGNWIASTVQAQEQISVNFGNLKYPDPENLPGNETNPYEGYASKGAELREFFVDFYQGHHVTQHIDYNPIPKEIWARPDNLVIRVTVPYSMRLVRVVGGYKSDNKGFAWFDQSASQQEIMDYLSEKLEALRIAGQLPLQVEELELAKIEELSKRGLLKEERSH